MGVCWRAPTPTLLPEQQLIAVVVKNLKRLPDAAGGRCCILVVDEEKFAQFNCLYMFKLLKSKYGLEVAIGIYVRLKNLRFLAFKYNLFI